MTIRDRVEAGFRPGSRWLWLTWGVVPVLVLAFEGRGVIASGLWILLSMWLGRQPYAILGIRRPRSVTGLLGFSAVLGILLWSAISYGIQPASESLFPLRDASDAFDEISEDLGNFLFWLSASWIVGAFFEELVFRGFVLCYGARLLGRAWLWPLALFSSLLFGLAHRSISPSLVLTAGAVGFLLAAAFILCKRNLLAVILAHGVVNTISVSLAYFD